MPVGASLGARGERRPKPSSVKSPMSPSRLRSSPSSVRRDNWGRETVLLLIVEVLVQFFSHKDSFTGLSVVSGSPWSRGQGKQVEKNVNRDTLAMSFPGI